MGSKPSKQETSQQSNSIITKEELQKCDERIEQWKKNGEKFLESKIQPNTNREQTTSQDQLILNNGPKSEVQTHQRHANRVQTESNAEQFLEQSQNKNQLVKQQSVPNLDLQKIEINPEQGELGQSKKITDSDLSNKKQILLIENTPNYESYLPESQQIGQRPEVQISIPSKDQQNDQKVFFDSADLYNREQNQYSPQKMAYSANQFRPPAETSQQFNLQPFQQYKFNKDDMFGTQMPGVADHLVPQQQQQYQENNQTLQPIVESPVSFIQSTPFQPQQIIQYYPPWLAEMIKTFGQYSPPTSNTNYGEILFQQAHDLSDGEVYEGYMQLGKKHGYGISLTENEFYQGYFFDDQKEGYGRILVQGGVMKSGLWRNGSIEADMKLQDGRFQYEGECLHSFPHGEGTLEDANTRYKGQFKNGQKQGKGVLYFKKDESRYEGYFEKDKMHGRGKYYFKSGKIHEGGYQNNKYHGEGVLIWPDGRSYKGIIQHQIGNFVNSYRQGKGIQVEGDGGIYDGQWQEDMKDGFGSYTKNGITITGRWKQNEFIDE